MLLNNLKNELSCKEIKEMKMSSAVRRLPFCFSPESPDILLTGRSSGLLPVEHLPAFMQWYEVSTVKKAYSYGDSSRF
jgi:hypothetical protein